MKNITKPNTITEECFKNEVIPVVECVFKEPLRIIAVLYFMFYTGVTLNEVSNLKRKDIDLGERTAKICGGKKGERFVMFTKEVKERIESYFSCEPETKNAFNIRYYALKATFARLKPYFKDTNFNPTLFRYSFANMLLTKGAHINEVSKLLGNRSLQATIKYLGIPATVNIREIYDGIMIKKKRRKR